MTISSEEPKLIEAGIAVDERGQVIFANDFDFSSVKRFYMVENSPSQPVRAFHGHLKEEKYVLPVSGSALVAVVKIDNPQQPSKTAQVQRFILSAKKPVVLHIPGGYANGFKSLESETKLIFFSTATLEESKADDYRFPEDYWGKEIWEIQNN